MIRANRIIRTALIAGMLAELGVLGAEAALRVLRRHSAAATGSLVASLSGYGLDVGAGLQDPGVDGCTVVRFVSRRCEFCTSEEADWRGLGNDLRAHRCKFIVLLPGLSGAPYYQTGNVPQIVWVPLDWAGATNLRVTPTAMVFERGKLIWEREGELDAPSLSDLRTCVRRLGHGS
ncbi:MAG TPA: hypothetical protein VN690_06195 [Terriglobales bacterium]|nr:hypothetical protein [Terriglobales bacterium]